MQKDRVWRQFEALPPLAQRQVADFISFLSARARRGRSGAVAPSAPLDEEPFVGLWRDREDMADGSAWVRRAREGEWTR